MRNIKINKKIIQMVRKAGKKTSSAIIFPDISRKENLPKEASIHTTKTLEI